jgi:fucose permease
MMIAFKLIYLKNFTGILSQPVQMKRNLYIAALIILICFVISFLTNVIGPLIPDIIKAFHLSYTLAGVLPLAFFIAYGMMSVPSATMLRTYKEKIKLSI